MSFINKFWQGWGITRSLLIYYGQPWRYWRMIRFYRQFIKPGDLCFDVGAHVGNRLWIWSKLQTRIIAIEPQPELMWVLKRLYGRASNITLVEKAVGSETGQATLYVSPQNPTVNTLSSTWIKTVQQEPSFAHTHWEQTQTVELVTLDRLIAKYGRPTFCKIDIEGYELEALRGLSEPIPTLSFEFIPVAMSMAIECLQRLNTLGAYEYNISFGETHRLELSRWVSSMHMIAILMGLSTSSKSGDVYARLRPH